MAVLATVVASVAAPRQVVVDRTVRLPTGPAQTSFGFTIHAQFPDFVILTVPHGARVSFVALSADRMEILSASTRPEPGLCRRRGALDVCTQGFEWCGLIQGRWRATLKKTGRHPIAVHIHLVFVDGVKQG